MAVSGIGIVSSSTAQAPDTSTLNQQDFLNIIIPDRPV